MADSKISGLAAAGALTGAELAVCVKAGVTSQTTTQAIADLAGGSNLGNSDLTSTSADRVFTLFGSLITDRLIVEAASGTDVLQVTGANTVAIPTGYLGVGTASLGPGFGGHKLFVVNSANSTSAINVVHSGSNGTGVNVTSNQTAAGSGYGFKIASTNAAAAVVKIGVQFDITNGAANYAIDFKNGDCRFNTTTGNKLGISTNDKIGFWNTAPIIQPTALTAADATATDGTIATNDTITNNLRVRLNELEAKLSTAGGGCGLIA